MADKILDDASIAIVKSANLPISLEAIEEIIFEEDSSEQYYVKHYEQPEWPGGQSGVTIALGYDLGYSTAMKVHMDFDDLIPASMVLALVSVVGVRGTAAHDAMLKVRPHIAIPWAVALTVFLKRDIPLWIATCAKVLPNFDKLGPTCKGILVSLAYNRGASFTLAGDRYREMRAIRADMLTQNFANIPAQFRSMARLWTGGVHNRRLREAALFQKGLDEMKGDSDATVS
jgi:hypothetical protein